MSKQSSSWVGQKLSGGRYHVESLLGEGGMGHVYRARDKNLDADVVIKVPRRAMVEDPGFVGRFEHEVRSLVRLSHPHIVKVTDVGTQDGLPFAIMQYLPGGSLEERRTLGAGGEPIPVEPSTLASWLPDIAAALDYVHAKGYVHRDVKPANILFDAEGHAFLSDFGVTKALASVGEGRSRATTAAGLVLGTPEYMAPELIMGETFDGRADQYALAITVYELLAGKRPFDGPTTASILVQQSTKEPPFLQEAVSGIPDKLAGVVHRGLSKKPKHRYADCASYAQAIIDASAFTSAADRRDLSANPTHAQTTRTRLKSQPAPIQEDHPTTPHLSPGAPARQDVNPSTQKRPLRSLLLIGVMGGGVAGAAIISITSRTRHASKNVAILTSQASTLSPKPGARESTVVESAGSSGTLETPVGPLQSVPDDLTKSQSDSNSLPIQPNRGQPVLINVRELYATSGRGGFHTFLLDEKGVRVPTPEGPSEETLRGYRWVVLLGTLDHEKQRENYLSALKRPEIAHPEYIGLDIERQVCRWDGTKSNWEPVDRDQNKTILENLPEEDEELTPKGVRFRPLVDSLPFLNAGYWRSVHVASLVRKPGDSELPAAPNEPKNSITQGTGTEGFLKTDSPVIMFRSIDFTVKPDTAYRYRVRIIVKNPNVKRTDVNSGVDNESERLFGSWSRPTMIVTMPADVTPYTLPEAPYLYKNQCRTCFQVVRWNPLNGSTLVSYKDFFAGPGEIVGYVTYADIPNSTGKKLRRDLVDFSSGHLVLETTGGPQSLSQIGLGGSLGVPATALLLRPDGTVFFRNSALDARDEWRLDSVENYQREVRETGRPRESSSRR